MKCAIKSIQHYPPHLRRVAALPWEIKNSNFLHILSRYGRKSKQIAKKFENRLRFDKIRECSKVGTFSKTQCSKVSKIDTVW